MRLVFVAAVLLYTIGLWIIGLVWLLVLVLPYLIIGATFVYIIQSNLKKRAMLRASVQKDAERQRQLNAQELAAWQAAAEDEKRNALRRDRALRNFDDRRDPRT